MFRVLGVKVLVLFARATRTKHTNTYTLLPHITHLTAKPSRMIGVQVGVSCVGTRALNTFINT